ncbi:MAG: ATP-dependent metallopeptidase FtsH/Yme1/Tma family protein [Polyangiaceae bacterium]|nr:ATP-dependent metallopeptidase FtsH/Yme1/Tma family protein [Polyangiaceae bacterium]MCB9609092.1 ATP-dependent metallopeptidase FtsH/Yme1/Tma family protein [Polyangiaceae bacterium]
MPQTNPPPRPSLPGGPPPSPESQRPQPWGLMVLMALLFAAFWGYQNLSSMGGHATSIPYTEFYQQVGEGKIEQVEIRGDQVTGKYKPGSEGEKGKRFTTVLPLQDDKDLLPTLRNNKVTVEVVSPEAGAMVWISQLLPFALLIGIFIWMGRRTSKMMSQGGPFGGLIKGRSKRFNQETDVKITFSDVAGSSAAKQDLQEVVEFLKDPTRFQRLGGKVPRGVLLVGPPGTGKTLIARAVAGEAGVPFFSINGSEFIEMFVGVGAARVRELFEESKKVSPAIIFIDEIDAVGRARGAGLGGGHDEREQTLNQLLSEMDGFSRNDLTIVIAATNRPDVLDPALLRPGRFDRRVVVDRPELRARVAILGVHTKNKPLGKDVDLSLIAKNTPGFSGADLANLCNEAALAAARRGANEINMEDFLEAQDKIMLGAPRETVLRPQEKRRVAIHEAGHAVVAHFSEGSDPLHRVTIIPRGMALGVTQSTPQPDKHLVLRSELETQLRMLLGGYAAEHVVLGEVSSGASNDLQRATDTAYKMVANYGMSDRLGPVYHDHKSDHPFLGQRIATESGTSDATVHVIEQEIRTLVSAAQSQAESLIEENRAGFDALVQSLLEHETVERAEIIELLGPGRSGEPEEIPAAVH